MKRLLIILTAAILSGMLYAEITPTGAMDVSVVVTPDEYCNVGVSVDKPTITSLPVAEDITVALSKSTGTSTTTGASFLYASKTVYLYYYYVGRDNATLTVTAATPLQIKKDETVVSSINYYLRFADANGKLEIPENWDGDCFKVERISTDTSSKNISNSTSVAVKSTNKNTVMTRGIWEITVYTDTLYGKNYNDNASYEGTIELLITSQG